MKCPVCASAHLVQDTRDLAYTYQGQSTVVPGVSGAFCPACGDGVFERVESSRIRAARVSFYQTVKTGQCR